METRCNTCHGWPSLRGQESSEHEACSCETCPCDAHGAGLLLTVPCHAFQREFGWSAAADLSDDAELDIYSDRTVRYVDPFGDSENEQVLGTLSDREWAVVQTWIDAAEARADTEDALRAVEG